MSYCIAKAMGISGKLLSDIHIAAHLHDIGKIGIPKEILNKEGKLFPHEWAYIQKHPEIGYTILSHSETLKNISKIVLHHHERWNGTGYPAGLSGEEIPLGSRIIGLAVAIDAMTSDRPYRRALDWETCRNEIKINKGVQFDPMIVESIEQLWMEYSSIKLQSERIIE